MFKGKSFPLYRPGCQQCISPRQAPSLGILLSPSARPQGTPPLASSKYHYYDQRSLEASVTQMCHSLVLMVVVVGFWEFGGFSPPSHFPFPHSNRTGRRGGGGEDREDELDPHLQSRANCSLAAVSTHTAVPMTDYKFGCQ